MQAKSKSFRTAVVGSPRRIEILTVVDISDPDIRYGTFTADSIAPWSNPEELRDKVLDPPARSGSVLSDISERLSGFGTDRTQQ